jgi:hypothetical protein
MGFGNRVRQQGKETYKLKLTNKNYKYYKLLESSKKVVGPVSAGGGACGLAARLSEAMSSLGCTLMRTS